MSDRQATQEARDGVEKAESGGPAADQPLEQAREENPPAAEAVEQEAADGPEGRGLSR